MTPRLPALTARQVLQKLRHAGFVFDRQAKGSHEIWRHLQQTGLSLEEFLEL
jgi:predicted RNA binding protein YcfA (HicA-like mRNA interferase family)